MIKAIIFDFDGVLVESVDIKTTAFARVFEAEGEDIVRGVIEYHLANGGKSRYEKFRYYYRELLKKELTEERLKELCSRFSNLVLQEVIKCPFIPGAKEFLDNCDSSISLFVTSATPEQELREIIDRRKMTHYFRDVIGAPKAKAEAVAEILANQLLSSSEALFVGDAMADYEAAKVNNIHFIARCDQNNHVFENIQCRKITDLTSLNEVIENINRKHLQGVK